MDNMNPQERENWLAFVQKAADEAHTWDSGRIASPIAKTAIEFMNELEVARNIIGWYQDRDFGDEGPPWKLKEIA